jgi:hypothetical protein
VIAQLHLSASFQAMRAYNAVRGKQNFQRDMGFMAESVRFRLREASVGLRLYALLAALAAGSTSGCGTSHATLDLIAPSTATAGTPFTVTVNVLYQGKPDSVINSSIHFTSSDPTAILPPDYYFTPGDAGSHTWTNGFTLSTPGKQTISGAIFDATGINGSATITVTP